MFSMVNALPDVSHVFFYHISLLRITPTTSSNFKVLEPETKLLCEYNNLFPTTFMEMKGIAGELGEMKILL